MGLVMSSVLGYFLQPPRLLLLLIVLAATYVHFRGRVRLKFARQITDHSTFTAPYNALVYLWSRAPNRPFLDLADFPELKVITDNWSTFREEGLRLLEESKITVATGDNDIGFHTFFKRGWKRFYLKWYGNDLPSARTLCPKSLALLDSVSSIHGAMFAALPPGGRLGRHRDPFAGSLRYHLGLRTPNSDACWIEVDGRRQSWRDGEAMIFDETYVHEALNETDVNRLILFCDVERPVARPMAALNRWAIHNVMKATGAPNEVGEHVGAINRLYGRLTGVIAAGKGLKARNRTLYYVVKNAVIILVIGLVITPWSVRL
jgi:beta-hydroxylase